MFKNDKKLKIVLVNPPISLEERYGRDLNKFGASSEPLGLAYLAANLEKNNYSVSIIDSLALNLDIQGTIGKIKEEKADLVGLTILTSAYQIVKKLSEDIKKELPQVKIILGGAHATALPAETILGVNQADYVCVGEGERTIVEVADFLSNGGEITAINGLAYRNNKGETVFNQQRDFESELDNFPPPARHLLPMEKYRLTASRVKNNGYCPTLIIARGCPFNCAFCSHPFGRSFRHHSVTRIIYELEYLIEEFQISQANFEADTLTLDKVFLLSLCQEIIQRGINKKIQWTCESRIDTVDEKLLEMMKKAGCWQISYGIESGVQRLLDLINKGVTLNQIEKTVILTKKIGITVRGFFILGLPTETIKESWQTINFAKKLDPFWAQFTVAIPYPGTPLFDQLKEKKQIKHFNWSDYNTWGGWANKQLPFISQGRTEEEIKKLQKRALISFYLRVVVFKRFLSQINSLDVFKKYFSGFLILLKNEVRDILC